MKSKVSWRTTILCGFLAVFLCNGIEPTFAVSPSNASNTDPNAFVYILNIGLNGNMVQYKGLRNGFVIGNGQFILTAAHCLQDFEISNHTLFQPIIISPYYGDFFEATIVAIDDKNDIAILKPNWDAHPGLDLETSKKWKKSKTITIAGYPPEAPCRGGNGTISTQITSEEVSLRNTNGKDRYAIQVGPVHYPGPGWSGCPLINPETGKIVSILSNEKYVKKFFFIKQHLIFGGSHDAICQLFTNNNLSYETSERTLKKLRRRHQFEQILTALNSIKAETKQQAPQSFKELCNNFPDSYLPHIIAGWVSNPPDNNSYFQKAVKIAPDNTLVCSAYGYNLFASENYHQAAKQFQAALDLDPNHLFARHGNLISLIQTDPNSGEMCALELIKQWPTNAEFYFEYSRLLRIQGRYAEELPVIQKAIELCDEILFVYQRHLADSLKANQKYQPAEQAYQTLFKTHECEHCWRAYASLLEKMGPEKREQKKEALKKAESFVEAPADVPEKKAANKTEPDKMLLQQQ